MGIFDSMDRHQQLVGESSALLETLERISAVAPLDRPVILVGERGTGKELMVERLHFLSPRWESELVKINCASLPDTLLESELFGHEAGAFTGATRRHAGRFERADGGTLFLDEIDSMSLRLQEKLLRVIEYGEFERVGGERQIRVDVRVVGATNADLPARAAEGAFRPDLLDRLAFDVITLPPLRHREGDVLLLAERFALAMTRELGRACFAGFSETALEQLRAHSWPGNVRELKNVVERAVYRTEAGSPVEQIELDPWASPWRTAGEVEQKEAPRVREAREESLPADFRGYLAQVERELLERALKDNRYNQRRTAEALGLSYAQLRGYLKKHRLLPLKR